MDLLVDNFNPVASDNVMCRNTASINWDGDIHDCDFNLAMGLPSRGSDRKPLNIKHINSLHELGGAAIELDNHCFGCTAGK